jgi:hypothetical protein
MSLPRRHGRIFQPNNGDPSSSPRDSQGAKMFKRRAAD